MVSRFHLEVKNELEAKLLTHCSRSVVWHALGADVRLVLDAWVLWIAILTGTLVLNAKVTIQVKTNTAHFTPECRKPMVFTRF